MAAAPPLGRQESADAVVRIALQVGATPVAHVDVATMLRGVCSALPRAVGATAAVLVLTEPLDPRTPEGAPVFVFASGDDAHRLGTIQHHAAHGPVPAALRGDRPLVVPDLTVSGPPELAAAAADCGLVRSLVVPLTVAGQPAGGLQLLAGPDATLDEQTAGVLWPLVGALTARLADARELAGAHARADQLAAAAAPQAPSDVPPGAPPDAVHQPTVRLPVVPAGDAAPDGPVPPEITQGDPAPGVFADGEHAEETRPSGQVRLGWEGPEHTPPPTMLPTRALPAHVPLLGRTPRPGPASVPEQRSAHAPAAAATSGGAPEEDPEPGAGGPPEPVTAAAPTTGPDVPAARADDVDSPTWRVPRHRLRDDA